MAINGLAIDPKETILLLEKWKQRGIPESEFKQIHHMGHPIKTFENYCYRLIKTGSRFRKGGRNQHVHEEVEHHLNGKLD